MGGNKVMETDRVREETASVTVTDELHSLFLDDKEHGDGGGRKWDLG